MPTPPLIDETRFKPRSLKQARALYAALVDDAYVSPAVARTVVMWLVMYPHDGLYPAQKTGYRKLLFDLGHPPWEPDGDMGAYISPDQDRAA